MMIFGTNEPARAAKNADDRHVGKSRDTLLALKVTAATSVSPRLSAHPSADVRFSTPRHRISDENSSSCV